MCYCVRNRIDRICCCCTCAVLYIQSLDAKSCCVESVDLNRDLVGHVCVCTYVERKCQAFFSFYFTLVKTENDFSLIISTRITCCIQNFTCSICSTTSNACCHCCIILG